MSVDQSARKLINQTVQKLCLPESYTQVYHRPVYEMPMPSVESLTEFIDICKPVLFPGYYGNLEIHPETMIYDIGAGVEKIYKILKEQILRGFCFSCGEQNQQTDSCDLCHRKSDQAALSFVSALPEIRSILSTDVQAAYEGDPAAKSRGEAIFCYPSINTITHYRIAHNLYKQGIPIIPRIITELAHSQTGIDIHPGAVIGGKFFIDHGTGVVIGETCHIGHNVRLYQGVTLGAKSFPLDENGNPIKGIKRHPDVEDNVIIYSGSTILGNITIGANSVIGGNLWITNDVEPGSRILKNIGKL